MKLCLLLLLAVGAHAQNVDFARQVRPLLSDRCFTCHGPDEANRKAGLRLDLEAPARAAAPRIVARINHANPAFRMPQGGKQLSAPEVTILSRWVQQGAPWQSHWAFVPPKAQPGATIDRLVASRLAKEGLRRGAPAGKAALIRRVSFDLTGLPPSQADLKDSYERVVDRLLQSPRYGEKWASEWLDAARYADTHGYQVDPEKQMWAWRDWVIQAFNSNMPFDRFAVEQIAGDLLPSASLEQKIATGFQRNHRVNTEGGSIAEEFHNENIVDRVSTYSTVFLGLTAGCARCHDHKYDPISARDFYSLYAFFNSVDEIGTGGPRDPRGNLRPVMKLPAPEIEQRVAEAAAEAAGQRKTLRAIEAKLAAGALTWKAPEWHTLKPAQVKSANGATLTVHGDGAITSTGRRPDRDIYTLTVETPLDEITAFRVELLPDAQFPRGGSGRGDDGKGVLTLFEAEREDGTKVEFEKVAASGKSPESLIDRVIRPMIQLKRGWSVDPDVATPHYAVIEPRTLLSGGRFVLTLGNEFGEGALLGRFRISVTTSEFPEPLTGEERLDKTVLAVHHLERRRANDELTRRVAAQRAAEAKIPTTMVMTEMATPRDTFVLARGAYDKPGGKVAPGVPAFLPSLPPGRRPDRLALAQWTVDPENPLTARVAVNRIWQSLFGNGLVKTSEDFGSQGEPPSHPELLDTLAVEFVRSGWDMKALLRKIVLSETYRQSSKAPPALIERDPENRLLARGPRFRLTAEMIRDQALAVSGLAHHQIGGPPVKPYQPDGLWEQLSVIDDKKLYVRSKGSDLYRRSLYTFWKRTVPPPGLMTFDAPTREFCTVRRPLSTTPLQALTLLNDETYLEASRKLAERMIREGGRTPAARLRHGFLLSASRQPSVSELRVLQAGWERRLTHYQSNKSAAAKLLEAGESPRDTELDPAELAAYTTAASVLLNLDEVITKQ
ncbi:MAG: DUF1553 domain-containing protein [Acidobacteria bacterium]|nr:DUF1553 domain-containing protein [Acidobacteriota bacterium]